MTDGGSNTAGSTALAPPPRRVRFRRGSAARAWGWRLVTLPFLAAAACLVAMVLAEPITLMVGRSGVGRVASSTRAGPSRDETHYEVTFSYDAGGGVRRVGHGRVDAAERVPPRVGETVPIVIPPPLPVLGPVLRLGAYNPDGLICTGAFTALWCGLVLAVTATAWVAPALDARRVRYGVAVAGTVTARRELRIGRGVRWEIAYRYAAADGLARTITAAVRQPLFARLRDGQAVTVLLQSGDAARHTLYEASAFEAVPVTSANAVIAHQPVSA